VRDHNLGTIRPGRSFTQEELDHFARRCGFSAGQMPDPKTAIRARECRRCCRLLSGYFSDRSAAAPAGPCSDLVLKAANCAGNRQNPAALGAQAPPCRVFGHAAWAAHLEPWPRETIAVKHTPGMIAEEANISPSRVLTSPRYRRVLWTRRTGDRTGYPDEEPRSVIPGASAAPN